jgi:hypothetical protein
MALRTWFADEDICRLNNSPGWATRQKKVSRKAAQGGYFTLAMLRHDCRIAQGMKGIDPDGTDRERAAGEAVWFKAHPAFTEEQRARMKAEGEKKTEVLHRARVKKTVSNIGLDGVSGEKGSWIPLSGNTP